MILSQDLILLYYLLCLPMQLAAPTTIFHNAKRAIAVKEKDTGGSTIKTLVVSYIKKYRFRLVVAFIHGWNIVVKLNFIKLSSNSVVSYI